MKSARTPRQQPDSVSSSFVQQATSGAGQPLPPALRSSLEPSFGHNFANVRIFHDDQAADGAAVLGAKAFTLGQDIVFGAGRYQPDAPEGLRLLTHELTHTIQQGQVPGISADRYALGRSGDALERQASAASSAVIGGRGAGAITSSAPAIQCELEVEEVQASMPEPTSSEMPAYVEPRAPMSSANAPTSYPGDIDATTASPAATATSVTQHPRMIGLETNKDNRVGYASGSYNEVDGIPVGMTAEAGFVKSSKDGVDINAGTMDRKMGAWKDADGNTIVGSEGSATLVGMNVAPGGKFGNFGYEVQGPNASAGASASADKAHLGVQSNWGGAAVTHDDGNTLLRGGVSAGMGFDGRLYGGERPGFGFDYGPVTFDYRSRGEKTAPGQVNDGSFPVSGAPGYRPEEDSGAGGTSGGR